MDLEQNASRDVKKKKKKKKKGTKEKEGTSFTEKIRGFISFVVNYVLC